MSASQPLHSHKYTHTHSLTLTLHAKVQNWKEEERREIHKKIVCVMLYGRQKVHIWVPRMRGDESQAHTNTLLQQQQLERPEAKAKANTLIYSFTHTIQIARRRAYDWARERAKKTLSSWLTEWGALSAKKTQNKKKIEIKYKNPLLPRFWNTWISQSPTLRICSVCLCFFSSFFRCFESIRTHKFTPPYVHINTPDGEVENYYSKNKIEFKFDV